MSNAANTTAGFAVHDERGVLDLVLRRVRLLVCRRLLWLASVARDDGDIATLIDDLDDPVMEALWQSDGGEIADELATVEAALRADDGSRLARLERVFALDDFDRDLLHICLAAAVDPTLERWFAPCHDGGAHPYPTLALVARLCGYGRWAAWRGTSPLRRWHMVSSLPYGATNNQWMPLTLDPAIRDWLHGVDDPEPLLVARVRVVAPLEPLPEWDVERVSTFVADALRDDPARTVVVHVIAPPGGGRKTYAACVASSLEVPLLAVDVDVIPDDEWEATFVCVQRYAFLQSFALAWSISGARSMGHWTESIAHFPMQFILRDTSTPAPTIPRAVELRVDLPMPSVQTRQALWTRFAPQAAQVAPNAVAELAGRFNARPGAIRTAAGVPGASAQAMARSLRDTQRDLLGGLAQPLECRFTGSDLVVSDTLRTSLDDFVHEARDRALFWEQPEARRLFPQGRALVALFTGTPGTGKTMGAQVVAAQLELDLFRIDLSTVVSKYVGETSQNLQRILSRAADMDVVLFFDEADALFARRTEVKDAHDRFANTDTNHLLQAIEGYGGIAILATNRKGNIDTAFIRRLRYVLDFARPDAAQRALLWTRLIDALAGDAASQGMCALIHRLAEELDLTGAQIKYAVLNAVFAARREHTALQDEHILRGLDREMAKEGRALSERDRARLR